MALISCPACEKQISEMASACPNCGHPAEGVSQPAHPAIQTIEQTSKGYKAGQFIGVVMICAGVVACTARAPGTSAGLMLIGLVLYLGSRMGAWWNNG